MTELEKIMNTEFAKRDDGKGMHIGTVKTLGDGIQMVSRLTHRLSPLMMKVCTETISDVLGSAAVHPDQFGSDSDTDDSDSESEFEETEPEPRMERVKSSVQQSVNDYRLQRILFGKYDKLKAKLLQEIGGAGEKEKKIALFSYLLLVTGLRQGRPRLGKKATTKDTEPFLGMLSITAEHIKLDSEK
ncbi:hypothetical protein WR25_20450 [Diploscapter pachys]|uniref:Uncharacterized protein n=1 Tax=Diploscapter pachys TaxID=2018661 RepID=A0A2A2LJF4_9BILA|nr:hypothetical protein WR25_20450 [Diploscapter pachys]